MSNPAYRFGAKLANATTFYERTPQDKQKKKNPLMRAEAAGESEETKDVFADDLNKESAAYKFGKSMCQPCDMSKHDRSKYQTGPMRALSAEEAIKPADGGVTETQETEHSEKDIANSGQKTSKYKQAAKGGLGGMFGNLFGAAARGFKAAPTQPPAMARPPLPQRPVTPNPAASAAATPKPAAPKLTPPSIPTAPAAASAAADVVESGTPMSAAVRERLRRLHDTGAGDRVTKVPLGAGHEAAAKSFYELPNAGSTNRRALGMTAEAGPTPPNWAQLSPEQRAAVQAYFFGK